MLKTKVLEEMYGKKLQFPGGGGCKKIIHGGEYGYFLELQMLDCKKQYEKLFGMCENSVT